MTDDGKSLDELKEETQMGTRQTDADVTPEFEDRLHDAFDAVEDGEVSKTISTYGSDVAALVAALEADDDRRETVNTALAEELGEEPGDGTTTELLRRAIRVGLREAGDGVADEVAEVKRERADSF